MQRCRGSRDLLPQDMLRFQEIVEAFRSSCRAWGYQEVKTPTLEYLHLFTSVGTLTPSMLRNVYSFLDWDGWSGERVVLRPEATIPAARLYVDNLKDKPLAKLSYLENIFSFEETGTESRERWQCGAELIGSDKPEADAELILLPSDIVSKLSLEDVELTLSHAGLLRALLQESGLPVQEQNAVLDQILDGDMEMLETAMGSNDRLRDSASLLFQLKGNSAGFLKNQQTSLVSALPSLGASLENFIAIADLLTEAGREYQIDVASGKGFEYYTGIIFQLHYNGQKIGGGGRYDDLIPLLGGGDVPASGFALYIDHLMGFLPDERTARDAPPKILVGGESEAQWRACVEAASLLREEGYIADLDSGYADAGDHQWTLRIEGEDKATRFVLTNATKKQTTKASSAQEVVDILGRANEASST
jgi:histidyl-tRNA synthetase